MRIVRALLICFLIVTVFFASPLTVIGDALEDAYDEGYEDGYEEGYDEGEEDGYEEGYESGRYRGYDEGYDEGYNEGSHDSYDAGYDEGFNAGYDEGYSDNGSGGGLSFLEGVAVILLSLIGFVAVAFLTQGAAFGIFKLIEKIRNFIRSKK